MEGAAPDRDPAAAAAVGPTPAARPGAGRRRSRSRPVGSPSSASSESQDGLSQDDGTLEASPLEGAHISLGEAAKLLASPPRRSYDGPLMIRSGDAFWE